MRTPESHRRLAVAAAVLLVGGAVLAVWAWWSGALAGLLPGVPIRSHCVATALGQSTELDPEQAGNAATIAAVAVRRGLPGRAATIGIATAMQESKLRNLNYGDRDSRGLFQQRPSQGWGTAEQVLDPVYASNAFYDVLVKIEGYQNLPITAAAQKVQRSAFPAAYGDHEPAARIFASALSGYSAGSLSCVLGPVGAAPAQSTGASGGAAGPARLVAAALAETGRQGQAEPAGSPGTVRFVLPGAESGRLAWALAQWAVSRAEGLRVTAVQTDGRQWRRDAGEAGWTALPAGPGSGTVLVQLAAAG